MKLVVALLTCDRYEYTKTTCETLLRHNDASDLELYYADDASTDPRVPELVESLGFRPVLRHSRRMGCSVTSAKMVDRVTRLAGEDALIWYLQNDIATIRPLRMECVTALFANPRIHILRTYSRWKSPKGWTEFARPAAAVAMSRMGPSKSPVASDEKTAGWESYPNPFEEIQVGATYWSFQPSITRAWLLRALLRGVENEGQVMVRSRRWNLQVARFFHNVTVHFGDDETPGGILDSRKQNAAAVVSSERQPIDPHPEPVVRPQASPVSMDNQHIFVCIASYADPELPRTLQDCLETAQHPENLRFGICWQDDPTRPVPLHRFRADERFRFSDHTVEESKGGSWARSIAQGLWEGEGYTLQIDSHMKFEPDWDVRLIRMMDELPSDKPLISANSPVFWYDDKGRLHRATEKGVPTSRVVDWKKELGWAPWVDYGPPNLQRPGLQRFVTGNFVFTHGLWNEQVRQDPDHYYWGEEFALTVRSFTWGFDLFLPKEIVVWHMCHFDGGPRRHWEKGRDVIDGRNDVAFERLRKLVYSDESEDLGRFGLGPVRTKSQFEIYAGFDLQGKRAHPDVFTGANPDPVTIRSDADWEKCITFEEAKATLL